MITKTKHNLAKLVLLVVLSLSIAPVYAQETTPEPMTTRSAAPDADQFELFDIVSGLFRPLFATGAGDESGRLFVMEQSGRIWIVRDDVLQNTPFLDLTGIVSQDVTGGYSERGLLGLAFHPQYSENGLFYVNYTDRSGNTHVVQYTVSADNPDAADPDSASELLFVAQPYPNHNGGNLGFGFDGYLYISMGDGGSQNDPLANGQNKGSLLAKILRIDVDSPDANRAYGIPADNPFFADPTFAPEVWSYGLRNPWRFSFDQATGDLYIGDVGQNVWEEINFQAADSAGGENYGWLAYEGNEAYQGPEANSQVTFPIATYSHSEGGCSVTGGYVYRGESIPDLQGAYLYSDYCSGNLWAAWRDESDTWQSSLILETGRQVSSFGQDDDGELYLIDYDGVVLKFVPAG